VASRERRESGGEYSGVTRDNTIMAKSPGAVLLPWEQLRLAKLTGQPDDVTSTPDRRIWQGWNRSPDSEIDLD
jgi:hypothetical protein